MRYQEHHIDGELQCVIEGADVDVERLSALVLPCADAWTLGRAISPATADRIAMTKSEVMEILVQTGVAWEHADAWPDIVEVFVARPKDFAEVAAGFYPGLEDVNRREAMIDQLRSDAALDYRTLTVVKDLASGAYIAMMAHDRHLVANKDGLTLSKKVHEYGAFDPRHAQILDAVYCLQHRLEIDRVENDIRSLGIDSEFHDFTAIVTTSGASAERFDQLNKGARFLAGQGITPSYERSARTPN